MKKLIVNADDFGYSFGINKGIIEAYRKGIVTSTSLMVNGSAVKDAIKLINNYPNLGLGLHFQIENEENYLIREVKNRIMLLNLPKIKKKFYEQIKLFHRLTGKSPDHLDSHHHVHKLPGLYKFITKFCVTNKIPYRGQINFIGTFKANLIPKSFVMPNLIRILHNLPEGTSEIMCHPGYVTRDLVSSLKSEREVELMTLCDPEIKKLIKNESIMLVNWKNL